jgi:N-acetyl-1-D-myo-inositol-2-amino-2-deoxy-alpha-D-glucopyranoside deacetylase
MSMLDGARSVLLVHAHPDDETLATGGLIAEMASRGIRVMLVTATRGERGEVVPGELSGLEGTDALTARREQELRDAAHVLGIDECYWLGQPPARGPGLAPRHYRDSGMSWIRPGLAGPAVDGALDDQALTRAPLEAVSADIGALIGHRHPSLVISYDSGGGYGHPDHVRVHQAALAASRALGTPFAEIVPAAVEGAGAGMGAVTEWYDLDAHLCTVSAALRCHASQLTVDGSEIVHSGGQRERITASLGLRLL